jgi:hypothetical protein
MSVAVMLVRRVRVLVLQRLMHVAVRVLDGLLS